MLWSQGRSQLFLVGTAGQTLGNVVSVTKVVANVVSLSRLPISFHELICCIYKLTCVPADLCVLRLFLQDAWVRCFYLLLESSSRVFFSQVAARIEVFRVVFECDIESKPCAHMTTKH